ncbi:unnamed protein product [Peniophora sp. CBMAI 1063]|nr:unnamed protein product [Peniophora sp. CBMAI 1063]
MNEEDGEPGDVQNTSTSYWQNALNARLEALPSAEDSMTEEAFIAAYDLERDAVDSMSRRLASLRNFQLSLIRERRNARCEVTRILPPELLRLVFLYHSYISEEYRDLIYHPWRRNTMLVVAGVSRRWRTIALNTGELWDHLHMDMSNPFWSTCWDRSANQPRTIDGHWTGSAPVSRREAIIDNLAHVGELRLFLSAMYTSDRVASQALLLSSAPRLHILDLSGEVGTWHAALGDFIEHRTAALQSLVLRDIHYPWGISIAALRSLTLTTFPHQFNQRVRRPHEMCLFSDVLRTLHTAVHLEELILLGEHVFAPPEQPPMPSVDLPVRQLSLSHHAVGRQMSLAPGCLLAALKAGSTMNVNMLYEGDFDLVAVAKQTALLLQNHLSSRGAPGPPEFTVLHLLGDCPEGTLTFWLGFDTILLPTPVGPEEGVHPVDQHSSLRVQYVQAGNMLDIRLQRDDVRSCTTTLLRSLSSSHIEHLQHIVLTGLWWHKSTTLGFLSRARCVESLTIYASTMAMAQAAAALLTDIIHTPSSATAYPTAGLPPGSMLLPSLRTLHVIGVPFNAEVQDDGLVNLKLDAVMSRFLDKRNALGCGIECLHLEDCFPIDERFLSLWNNLVPRVITTDPMYD